MGGDIMPSCWGTVDRMAAENIEFCHCEGRPETARERRWRKAEGRRDEPKVTVMAKWVAARR